jgi:hypothetical protein
MRLRSRLLPVALAAVLLTCVGVEPDGCLSSSDPLCVPPSPCAALAFTCASTAAHAARMERPDQRLPGLDAIATPGDLMLSNDYVRAFFDAPEHPHHLATSGGSLLDFAPVGGTDHLNQVYQITGILPRDGARYTEAQLINEPGLAAVVFRGTLDGFPRARIVTRYELRACDRGLRVRTEVHHGGREAATWFLSDAWFWGDRSMTPFAPGRGEGFRHRALDLAEIDGSWSTFDWLAASSHVGDGDTSYASVACGRPQFEGVHDPTISAAGLPRTVILPGDGLAFERMIFTGPGNGLASAAALALDAHARMNGGALTEVRGRLVDTAGNPIGGSETLASMEVYEPGTTTPDDPATIAPWSQVVPGADGTFSVRVPADRSYRLQLHRFGRPYGEAVAFRSQGATMVLPDIVRPIPARLSVRVSDAVSMQGVDAELVLVPAEGTEGSLTGTVHGFFRNGCAPYLGPPHGSSPACNRALARGGSVEFALPPGSYTVYAHAGLQRTLGRATVTVTEGTTTPVQISLRDVAVFPQGALMGDFHVHGGRSFDTAFPDRDRVLSFVTSGVDVVIATDHDVCTSYDATVSALGLGDRVTVISGSEQTGLVPFLIRPGSTLPRTLGHWNFWPLRHDPTQLNDGSPDDERQEPGQVFDRMRARVGEQGVIQCNHPVAEMKVGRDEGYLRALGYDPRLPLPMSDDGTGAGYLWRRPGGPTGHRNIDWDTQEVMNGAGVVLNLGYRALWFQMLSQGIIRAGTANSDSHSMVTETMGYPRNVVLGNFPRTGFDRDAFNAAIRGGRIIGTNGPHIEATVMGMDGAPRGPGVTPFVPVAGATLNVEVRAVPWVAVTEVRIIVNGAVSRTLTGADIQQPADPYGTDGVVRWRGSIPLSELTHGRDAWVVIEAGMPLPRAADLVDDDGYLDHVDGDGDGAIDDTGMVRPRPGDPRYPLDIVAPGSLPFAFTNPFLVDMDGGGWRAPR